MCSESLNNYIKEYRLAKTNEDKLKVCMKYKDKTWSINIGMEAWDEVGEFALLQHEILNIGKVNLLIPLEIASSYKQYKGKAPLLDNLINQFKCELILVEWND